MTASKQHLWRVEVVRVQEDGSQEQITSLQVVASDSENALAKAKDIHELEDGAKFWSIQYQGMVTV